MHQEGSVIKGATPSSLLILIHITHISVICNHFNQNGHQLSDMKVTVLEHVKNSDPEYRKERETYLIIKFNTFYGGMNKKP